MAIAANKIFIFGREWIVMAFPHAIYIKS